MVVTLFWTFLGIYILLSVIITPFQYRYLTGLKEEQQKAGQTQLEYYGGKTVSEQILTVNAQGNPLFWGANIFASVIIKIKQK
ncbi:DUF3949 domain-containing protein [Gracilibacillus sp. S3-1-1]|uniref:DUF3949 domain-containing protein n=1 Tax=Gracilibacillus pellucidus TaxID=3095368 RepID=A0ACC6M4N3_9BACI|nr:DUF3949 domain-containing protein [Gracilibacillus sp. S3-1-1]MDX8045847.1 DUF3949 domain-containing protein [Gracilibacillus sp. S3-1-1]